MTRNRGWKNWIVDAALCRGNAAFCRALLFNSSVNISYMQAFSTPVNMDVYVNDVYLTTVNGGTQNVATSSGDIPVNMTGDFTLSFVQASSSAGQITIDNIDL